jgi:hypothetical protein
MSMSGFFIDKNDDDAGGAHPEITSLFSCFYLVFFTE